MNILEKEIEDVLFETLTSNHSLLQQRGLFMPPTAEYARQIDLGTYGKPDIVGFTIHPKEEGYRRIDVIIYELKKEDVNVGTLMQACRYKKGIEEYLDHRGVKDAYLHTRVCLIGKTIEKRSDWVYILPFLENVSVYTYSIDLIKGIRFTSSSNFSQVEPKFPYRESEYSELVALLRSCQLHLDEQEPKIEEGEMPF
jgi:hypothetical protein